MEPWIRWGKKWMNYAWEEGVKQIDVENIGDFSDVQAYWFHYYMALRYFNYFKQYTSEKYDDKIMQDLIIHHLDVCKEKYDLMIKNKNYRRICMNRQLITFFTFQSQCIAIRSQLHCMVIDTRTKTIHTKPIQISERIFSLYEFTTKFFLCYFYQTLFIYYFTERKFDACKEILFLFVKCHRRLTVLYSEVRDAVDKYDRGRTEYNLLCLPNGEEAKFYGLMESKLQQVLYHNSRGMNVTEMIAFPLIFDVIQYFDNFRFTYEYAIDFFPNNNDLLPNDENDFIFNLESNEFTKI